jgi:hypothetical protein
MKFLYKRYCCVIIIFICVANLKAQQADTIHATENPAIKIAALLKEGVVIYDVMNGIRPNTRLSKLSKKINVAIHANRVVC